MATDRLRKERDRLEVDGARITLVTGRDTEDMSWPRMITMANAEGVGMLGLSRLSGHSFYELAWEGGLHVRRFEISGTTRNKIPFEHIELATLLAETLGADYGLQPEPVTPVEVEAAYLRRMKAAGAELGAPPDTPLPRVVEGRPVAAYRVGAVQGKGAWYNLGGRVYCQECAGSQAGKAGVTLAQPVPSGHETVVKYPQTGRATSLKPRLVKVGPLENVEGYAVWTGKRDTGLTLVPEVKLVAGGESQINKSRWFVNYDRAGRPVAGPYESVNEARGMASLLAHFNWAKDVASFNDDEIRAVTSLANQYREELEFARHLKRIAPI